MAVLPVQVNSLVELLLLLLRPPPISLLDLPATMLDTMKQSVVAPAEALVKDITTIVMPVVVEAEAPSGSTMKPPLGGQKRQMEEQEVRP